MLHLILTMLVALDNYNENDLKFTKKDIDKLIKKYDALDDIDCNERGWIVLYNNGYINNEKISKHLEAKIKGDDIWITIDGFDRILDDKYQMTEISILKGEIDWEPRCYYENEIQYHWGYYTEETLKEIIKFCVNSGIETEDGLMTTKNTYIKDKQIYFKNNKLSDLIEDDDFEELKRILNESICDEQELSEQSAIFKKVENLFKSEIGTYEIKENGDVQIKLNVSLTDIENDLKNFYGEFDFEQENFGNMYYILNEMEYFKMKKIDYDYISYGTNKELLNEITIDKLNEFY